MRKTNIQSYLPLLIRLLLVSALGFLGYQWWQGYTRDKAFIQELEKDSKTLELQSKEVRDKVALSQKTFIKEAEKVIETETDDYQWKLVNGVFSWKPLEK